MRILVTVLAALCVSSVAIAADVPRIITASGMSERKIVPDEAHVNVNISAIDKTLETAKAEHDRKLNKVLAIAKRAGIEQQKIRTDNATIRPQYSWDNNKQNFKGYVVQTSLDITLKKIDGLGELMDKIASAKLENAVSNEYSGLMHVHYVISDPHKVREDMLVDAIKNARSKAERMAAAAGANLGRAIQINEGGTPRFDFPPDLPMLPGSAMSVEARANAVAAPPPGEQQLNANVTVSFELKD